MKVLCTGAGALLGQGILRSLLAMREPPAIVACDPSPLAPGLYWTPHRHLIPMARDPGYLAAIEALLARERPDAVLVGTDVELAIFAEHRAALEARHGTRIVVASPEVVAIADDKYLTYQFLERHGFAPPASRLPGEHGDLVARFGFPLVVKPRVGARSVGFRLVHDAAALDRALAEADGLVVQEHLGSADEEYTAGTLTFGGACQASIVMRRDLRDGNTYRAYVDAYPALNEQVRAMAVALGAHGPANFQFRLDGGVARVFEINARFSGTTPLRMHVGFNEVELTLRHLLEGAPVVQPAVRPAVVLRYFTETVLAPDELVR